MSSTKILGDIGVKLTALTAEFGKRMTKAEKKLRSFEATSKKIAKTAGAVFAGLAVPMGTAIKFASDVEEQNNVLAVSFGSMAKDVKKWAAEFGGAVGRSKMQMGEFAGTMQATLAPMSSSRDAAADMSMQLSQLAVDLGSLRNVADEDAFAALRAGMIGSMEPMLQFGVVMTQANLQTFALSQGIDKTVQSMSEAEKTALRFAFIMDKTRDAQGDAAKTSEGFANTMKAIKASLSDVAVDIGTALLPAATKLANMLKRLIQWFGSLSQKTKSTIAITGAMTMAVAGLTAGVGVMGSMLPKIIDGWKTFGATIKAATKTVWTLRTALVKTTAIAGAAVGVVGLVQLFNEGLADPDKLRRSLGVEGRDVGITEAAGLLLKGAFERGFETIFDPIAGFMTTALDKVGEAVDTDKLTKSSTKLQTSLGGLSGSVKKTKGAMDFAGVDLPDEMADEFNAALGGVREAMDFEAIDLPEDISDEVSVAMGGFRARFADMVSSIGESLLAETGEFGQLADAARQGAQAGGVWGAIIAVAAEILKMTQFFERLVDVLNNGIKTAVMSMDQVLAGLAPLLETINKLFVAISVFTKGLTVLEPALRVSGEIVSAIADVTEAFFDMLIKFWNKVAENLAKAFDKLPWDLGKNTARRLRDMKMDTLDEMVNDFNSQVGDMEQNMPDLGNAALDAAEAVRDFSESLTNIPQGFKVDPYRFLATEALGLEPGALIGDTAIEPAETSMQPKIINNEINISGVNDPVELYEEIKKLQEEEAFVNTGTVVRAGGENSVVQPR